MPQQKRKFSRSTNQFCCPTSVIQTELQEIHVKLKKQTKKETYQVVVVGELGHGGALAAGDDERVEAPQLIRLAHLHPVDPDPPQRCPDRQPTESVKEHLASTYEREDMGAPEMCSL